MCVRPIGNSQINRPSLQVQFAAWGRQAFEPQRRNRCKTKTNIVYTRWAYYYDVATHNIIGKRTMNTLETTQIRVNVTNLLKKMAFAFTTKTILIAELLQNARRAGATKVSIAYTEDGTLLITDNGAGIESFDTLLEMAESGWDDAIQQYEKPFGMGFFSALYSAERVIVSSRNKRIAFDTADALSRQAIPIESIGMSETGTGIILFGLKLTEKEVHKAVHRYAKGFPIAIEFQCRVMQRPDACGPQFLQLECGQFWRNPEYKGRVVNLYLQGLPVGYLNASPSTAVSIAHVLHLDCSKFNARLPDRECLIDQHDVEKQILTEVAAYFRSHYETEIEGLRTHQAQSNWLHEHADALHGWGLLDLANTIDVIPRTFVAEIDEPYDAPNGDSYTREAFYSSNTDIPFIDRSAVESGLVTLCDNLPNYLDQHLWANAAWAHKHGWLALTQTLATDHWAKKRCIDVEALEVSVGYSEIASGYYSGSYLRGKVVLCECYSLTCEDKHLEINDLSLAIGNDSHDAIFIIPSNGNCYQAATMAASFTDEWGIAEDDDRDHEVAELENYVRSIDGTSSADTLKALIAGTSWATASNLSQSAILVLTHTQQGKHPALSNEIVAVDATTLLKAVKGVIEGLQGADDDLRAIAEPLIKHPALLPSAA